MEDCRPLRRGLMKLYGEQIPLKQVCKHLGVRPISLWDSEYGCAPFRKLTQDIAADKVMRLRPNRCLWAAPPPIVNKGKGRPRIHGEKFKFSGPETWPIS